MINNMVKIILNDKKVLLTNGMIWSVLIEYNITPQAKLWFI